MMTVLSVLIISSISSTESAMAMESPLKKIAEFSREKIRGVKKIVIINNSNKEELIKNNVGKVSSEEENSNEKSHIEQVEEAVEFASKKTGVREDFLMGMLVVESDLGRKTGDCSYREVEDGAEKSYMNGQLSYRSYTTFLQRRETIKNLANKLGYDYENLQVSCNPSRYAGTGGAMGIPQFMPDTWMLFEDEIGKIVGKKTPDPWNVKDGIVAMALLLADTGGVREHNYYSERNAAKMYLSGTTSSQYDWYANQIMYWSKNHRKITG